MGAARDFLKMLEHEGLPLFNPLHEEGGTVQLMEKIPKVHLRKSIYHRVNTNERILSGEVPFLIYNDERKDSNVKIPKNKRKGYAI